MFRLKDAIIYGPLGLVSGALYYGDEHVCYFYELYEDEKEYPEERYRTYVRGPLYNDSICEVISGLILDLDIK